MIDLRVVLAATDLSVASDVVLQSAAAIAERAGATLHVAHVAPPWETDTERRRDILRAQLRRCFPHTPPLHAVGTVLHDRPFHGILVQAAEVRADLIVVGPHRAGAQSARWRPSTAERVARAADVPCLVVRTPLTAPVRRVGVATGFTLPDQGALNLACEWAPWMGDGATTLTLAHVQPQAAAQERPTEALRQERDRLVRAGADCTVRTTVLEGDDITAALLAWAEQHATQLLVVTASERRGLRRLWAGSAAARVTAEASCSVLLVPPALWRRAPVHLNRLAVVRLGGDKAEASPLEAAPWVQDLVEAPAAREAVPALTSDEVEGGTAAAARPDLLLLRADGDMQVPQRSLPGAVRRVLEAAPQSVLVLRRPANAPPRHVLVAVDTGELWYEKFGWAKLIADRFDARLTIFHAVTLSPRSRVRRTVGGELVPALSVWMKDNVEEKVVPAMRAWLWERVHLAGLPEDRVEVVVVLQAPDYAIPLVMEQYDADLAVVAAHRAHTPGRAPLSRVTRAVLRGGDYPVLAVVDRARSLAARAEEATPELGFTPAPDSVAGGGGGEARRRGAYQPVAPAPTQSAQSESTSVRRGPTPRPEP
jgi:nucleotide-binding universal stress UspA family protein